MAYAILGVSLFFLYFISPVTYFIIASVGVGVMMYKVMNVLFEDKIKQIQMRVSQWGLKIADKIHIPTVESVKTALN